VQVIIDHKLRRPDADSNRPVGNSGQSTHLVPLVEHARAAGARHG